jgi:hypothetical protein
MSLTSRVLSTSFAILLAMSCAEAPVGTDASSGQVDGGAGVDSGSSVDAPSCGASCDQDGDGVSDGIDQCADTPTGEVVNQVGCADSQLTPTLEPEFPPYGLTWTTAGDLGRDGGLTWTYTSIQRGDMFHIYWIVCDDPATPCGISLDGPIDAPSENWQFSAADSDLAAGRLVFTNTTQVPIADESPRPLSGRLTITIGDLDSVAIPSADVTSLGVSTRMGEAGAEITGTSFRVVMLAEVQDSLTSTWTPYLDYYDAAPTPDTGAETYMSIAGSFYDE